jgi:hypothetical protein
MGRALVGRGLLKFIAYCSAGRSEATQIFLQVLAGRIVALQQVRRPRAAETELPWHE